MAFKYKIDQCDVREVPKLTRYRERMLEWRLWMSDDQHSILQQIYHMMWDDAVFRTLNEARRLTAKRGDKRIGFNPPLINLLDRGYVASQALAIRRITVKESDSITLPRVIADIKKHADLFTREIFVANDGLPFDPAPLRNAWELAQIAKGGGDAVWLAMEGPDAWSGSEFAHDRFEKFAWS